MGSIHFEGDGGRGELRKRGEHDGVKSQRQDAEQAAQSHILNEKASHILRSRWSGVESVEEKAIVWRMDGLPGDGSGCLQHMAMPAS